MPTYVFRHLHAIVFTACALTLWLLGALAHASLGELPTLSMTHYASPSGEWVLTIDPSSRDGIGLTRYEMRHHDAIVWETTLPFALWHAAVADDGSSGGAGYDTGYAGIRDKGHFIVALFDAQGHSLGMDKTPRSDEMAHFHDFAYPRSDGVWLDPERDVLVVRVKEYDKARDAFPEHWWHYDLARGERTRAVEPQKPTVETGNLGSAHQMIPVQGTPLVLAHSLHWINTDANQTAFGSYYAVLDQDGQPIWTHLLQADIATDRYYPHERLRQLEGVRSPLSQHFSVQSLQRGLWLGFRAVPDRHAASGWRIEATDDMTARRENPAPQLASVELTHLGSIDLRAATQTEAPSRVERFAIDAQGRIGVIEKLGDCGCEESQRRWVLYSTDGERLSSHRLDVLDLAEQDTLRLAALTNGRWLITASSLAPGSRARAFTFDAQKFQPVVLGDFQAEKIAALAAAAGDGFVLLEEKHAPNAREMLHGHDGSGKRLWSVISDYGSDTALFSPEDVAVLRDGTVAVLENAPKKIKLYDARGQYLEAIDLKMTWPHPPNYPTAIIADADGGFWIEDFQGKAQLVHMSREGKVTRMLEQVRYGDARAMPSLGSAAVAPGGALWAHDYTAVFQLDASGQAQLTIGDAPDAGRLGTVEALSVTLDGRILALDGRNYALHQFDANGTLQRVMVAGISDFPANSNDAWIVLMPTGEALAGWNASGYVHFDADGTRTGFRRFAGHRDRFGEALPHVRPDRLWWREFDGISLLTLGGTRLAHHAHDANGRWFSGLTQSALAPDGSLAVATGLEDEPAVTLLDTQGALIASWPVVLPEGERLSGLAFDGQTVMVLSRATSDDSTRGAHLLAFDTDGHALFRAEPKARGAWEAFHVRRGDVSELWLRNGKIRLERHVWPKPGVMPGQKAH